MRNFGIYPNAWDRDVALRGFGMAKSEHKEHCLVIMIGNVLIMIGPHHAPAPDHLP